MSEIIQTDNSYFKGVMTDTICYRRDLKSTDNVDDVVLAGNYTCEWVEGLPDGVNKYGTLRVSKVNSRVLQEFFPDAKSYASVTQSTPVWREKIGSEWAPWRYYSGEKVPISGGVVSCTAINFRKEVAA